MDYTLADLIDIPQLQELMDVFYTFSATPTAILDRDGTVLTATGWQAICTQFHRTNPACTLRCQQSDAFIIQHLGQGDEYVIYECANGLVDVANPILVEGKHVGTVFTGQFLLAPPDVERFSQQAETFGFDTEQYLLALQRVPIVRREHIQPILHYLSRFTSMLAQMGYERLQMLRSQERLREEEQERMHLYDQLLQVSSPLIPLADNVIIAPLVGTVDSVRAAHIMETLLEGVGRYRAEVVILDVTGMPLIDTQVANALISAARAVQLLGAEVILTGINSVLAQTIVMQGIDLDGIITLSTVQAGIAYAMHHK